MTTGNSQCAPTFSLVVNTTDRAGPLRTLLRALEQQSYPHFEVIAVVGPTRDNTLEVLSEYEGRVRVLRCPRANLSQSRNVGLLAARGDIVAYIDDDAVPSRRWLEQLARLFEDPCLDATGGVVYLVHPNQPLIQHRIGIFSSLAEQVDVQASWLEHVVPPGEGVQWVGRMMGTNMAFRRRTLLEAGGFDEFYIFIAEETDLALRLVNAGRIVHPVKEAAVYHVPASSRNRVVWSHTGRWWLHTRSSVYCCIKNGPLAGDPPRAVARRCADLVRGRWRWYGELRRGKAITPLQYARMCAEELRGLSSGALGGVLRSRKLIAQADVQARLDAAQPIQRFQNGESQRQASVDPVSGQRAVVSISDPPLRVCLLSSTYPPEQYDGVGRLTHLMARGLFEQGHTVHVITHGEEDRVTFYDGAYVHQITYRLERYDRYRDWPGLYHSLNRSHAIYEKVQRLILNDGIQVVDSPLWQFEGLATAVSRAVPVVVRLVTSLRQIAALQGATDGDTRLMGDMEQALLEQADHLLPNTRATLDTVRRFYDLPPGEDRYTIVPYGIVPVPEGEICPFDLQQVGEARTVLYVGRLEKRKGILDLFEAIPLVLQQVPGARFVIAGSDNSLHDGFQRQTGMDYPAYFAGRYPELTSRVEFMGMVDNETLQALYQSCDLFVAPSLYESFGLIYLEAMNYAKPVVGCRAGGVPEVVDDGVTGRLVEPEAPAALAEALVSLLRSPKKLHEMGQAGRQRLLEEFGYKQMARNFEQVYRRVIHAGSVRDPEGRVGVPPVLS